MKHIANVGLLVALIVNGAPALADDDQAAEVAQRLQQTIAELELTDEQIERVKPVLQDSMNARRAIMSSYGLDPDNLKGAAGTLKPRQALAMRKELKSARAETLTELEKILSEEQLDNFKRILEERREEMRDKIRAAP
ncbi:MAG: hypothetical protein AAF384_08115 [Pseudomonadota bacterium]